ncbi:MAG: type II toxin-antitoxin system VapC family toxin [Verrucomicrobiota bacterium JB022]|nr:type II toxin-antitoxin system VapC family toxin [Verrucomicrobiota bacterium JB022]
MIFDTDVLIWCFRGNSKAAEAIRAATSRAISAVTLMELHQGARNKQEQKQIGKFLRELSFSVLPLSENISHRACIYVEEYSLSDSLEMADALIAATAVEYRHTVLTGNGKHYRMITEIDLEVFRKD